MYEAINKEKYLLLFFTGLFFLYLLAPTVVDVNQWSRYDLMRALAFDHSIRIEKYMGNTIDWSGPPGHGYFYTNKAPGTSFLGAPFLFIAAKIYGVLRPSIQDPHYHLLLITDVFITIIPSVILSLLLYLFIRRQTKEAHPAIITFGYAVATIVFKYSASTFGHQTAAVFVFAAFYLLLCSDKLWLSGAFFGLSVLTEYSMVLLAPGFLLLFFGYKKNDFWSSLLKFCIGGLPAFVIFVWYHKTAFGGYLTLPMKYNNPLFWGEDERSAVRGVIGYPRPTILFELLFGQRRGLFLISPVLLLALIGSVKAVINSTQKELPIFCLWSFTSFLAFNASFNGWHGGNCWGPRYLVPMLPFLVIGLVWIRHHSKLFYTLLVVSVLNSVAIAAIAVPTGPDDMVYAGLSSDFGLWPKFILLLTVASALFLVAKKVDRDALRKTLSGHSHS